MCNTTCACLIVVVIGMMYMYNRKESFTSRDRATKVNEWFNNRMNPSYTSYKQAIPESNIVEYEGALKLYQAGKGTVDNIKQLILS